MSAVTARGDALPWYTYPCIDFLKYRDYTTKTVLEFGAGQSTIWWGRRAASVVALEGDESWFKKLGPTVPPNVELHLVANDRPSECVEGVNQILAGMPGRRFDVVVIDGLWRYEMIEIAARVVRDDGIIVCDNAEGYGFLEGFKGRSFRRVDFFGYAPGVVLPHCTSIFFSCSSFVFEPSHPIPVVARDR